VDLVNRLIDCVANYQAHEKLTHITISSKTQGVGGLVSAMNDMGNAMQRVNVIASSLPDLKASTLYQSLMGQLSSIEDELQSRRERYNAMVRSFNTARSEFPNVLFVNVLGVEEATFFDPPESQIAQPVREFSSDDQMLVRATVRQSLASQSSSNQQFAKTQPPYADAVLITAQPAPDDTRDCPHCAERIKARANVCRFCGRSVART
jgi:LemA protein